MASHDTNDPLARDIERITALRDQGRLTDAEAERLIAVLRGDAPVAAADDEPDHAGEPEAPSAPEVPSAPEAASEPEAPSAPASEPAAPPPASPAAAAAPATANLPTPPSLPTTPRAADATRPADDLGVRWLRIEMLAADLLVEPQPGLEAPRLRREVEDATLEPHGGGWRLRYRVDLGSWSIFGNHRGSPARIEVDVPLGMGVDLDVKAGDVAIRGVTHVRGRMLAGDLAIDGASYVDVDKKAGDFEARIRPTAGRQRLVAKAGDLDVVLLPGSDVRVSADVKVGDLSVKGAGLPGARNAHGIGQRYSGTLGAGTAELELRLAAGSMTLRTEG